MRDPRNSKPLAKKSLISKRKIESGNGDKVAGGVGWLLVESGVSSVTQFQTFFSVINCILIRRLRK